MTLLVRLALLSVSCAASFLDQELAMLSDSQRSQLKDIRDGKITKAQVEIVLSNFDEETAWSDFYGDLVTTYCKGGNAGFPGKVGCTPLPNVGREGHTYLHHIVENYDKLAEWTVFSQASEPTIGYKGHREGGGHMLPGISFHDYVLRRGEEDKDGAFFVFTGRLEMTTLSHSLRLSYANLTASAKKQPTCPSKDTKDGWQTWWDLGWFKGHLEEHCGVDPSQMGRAVTDYWNSHLRLPRPPADVVFFAQGARFAASKQRILQRPRSFYEEMLKLVSSDQDPCANYLNEWFWYYIIGTPHTAQSPCEVGESPVIARQLLAETSEASSTAELPVSMPCSKTHAPCREGWTLERHCGDKDHGDMCIMKDNRGRHWHAPRNCEIVGGYPPYTVMKGTQDACRAPKVEKVHELAQDQEVNTQGDVHTGTSKPLALALVSCVTISMLGAGVFRMLVKRDQDTTSRGSTYESIDHVNLNSVQPLIPEPLYTSLELGIE